MIDSPSKALDAGAGEASCAALRRAEQQLRIESGTAHFHPLESIAFFRRWPRSFLRNLIYTIIFNAMFAAGFTLIGVLGILTKGRSLSASGLIDIIGGNLLISNVIGFAFWGVLEAIDPLMRWVNLRGFFTVVMFYSVLGTAIVTGSFFAPRRASSGRASSECSPVSSDGAATKMIITAHICAIVRGL